MARMTQECTNCEGDGVVTVSGNDVRCWHCNGTGIVVFEDVPEFAGPIPSSEATSAMIVHTYMIIEATDASEYNALTDNQKAAYNLIISAGRVSLAEETQIRTRLFNLFGEGTTTRANLEALITALTPIIEEEEE